MADMMAEAERCYKLYGAGIVALNIRQADSNAKRFTSDYAAYLLARVRQLEGALREYANPDNWASVPTCREDYWRWSGPENLLEDPGATARAALLGGEGDAK